MCRRWFWLILLVWCAGCGGGSSSGPRALTPGSFTVTARSANVSVEFDRFLVATVLVNGVPGRFLLDTGAEFFGISAEFADRVGLETVGEATIRTVVGSSTTEVRRINVFQLANVVGEEIDAVVLELPDLDGAVGEPFFQELLVRIDYQSGNLTFVDPLQAGAEFFSDVAEFEVLPIDRFVLEGMVAVNDLNPVRVLIDTGSAGGLHLAESQIGESLSGIAQVGSTTFTASNGSLPGVAYIVDSLRLGGFALDDQLVIVQQGSLDSGLLGNLVLKQFTVILDPSRGLSYFRRDEPLRFELL